jgi:membrane-associated phospholipid phosphatase
MNRKSLAEILSLVFNPPIVATPTFLVLILLQKSENPILLFLITMTFGTIVPLIVVVGLTKHGTIPDIWASKRETRFVPFSGAIGSYLLGSLVLVALRSPALITAMMLCYGGNTVIMMLISLKWKISIHATGIAGPLTALVFALGIIAVPLLLLILPVGWARLTLKAHTPMQVIAGALLTVLITWVQLGFYTPLL